jgi:hypothetical protein
MAPETPGEAPDVEALPDQPRLSLAYDDVQRADLLGTGGNAEVYRATVPGYDGPVALKVPRVQGTLSSTAVEQFVEEAETWAKLDDHPHVVSLLDWGERPMPWLLMEYMDAGHLGERVGEVEPREAVWICSRVARALRHAHTRGVAHLDLKPANVLFATSPGDVWDVPKVSDWGLAKLLLEHSQSVEGLSPQYAAPEQFDAEAFGHPDIHTDVFQLGVVAYELLTGEQPFTGSHAAVMRAVMEDDPAPPSEVADVPPAVDDVVLRALEKEKRDRYEDVLLFRDALDELLVELDDVADGAPASTSSGADGAPASTSSGGATVRTGSTGRNRGGRHADEPDAGELATEATGTAATRDSAVVEVGEEREDQQERAGDDADQSTDTDAGTERADATTRESPGSVLPSPLVEHRRVTVALVVAAVYGSALWDVAVAEFPEFVWPSLVVPVLAGLLAGPAGVAGVMVGSLFFDLWYGVLGLESVGFAVSAGIQAAIPYLLWGRLGPLSSGDPPDFRRRRGRQLVEYVALAVTGAVVVWSLLILNFLFTYGHSIGYWLEQESTLLAAYLLAAVLGPPVLYLAYPRLADRGWLLSGLDERTD